MDQEIFILENNGTYVLFAPIKGIIMEISKNEAEKLTELIEKQSLDFETLFLMFPEIDQNNLLNVTHEAPSSEQGFFPTSVVLFPSFDCRLRCIYCYSEAGDFSPKTVVTNKRMSWKIAKASIDFIVGNAEKLSAPEASIEFHGGGEPTENWGIFQKTILYFKKKCVEKNIRPRIYVVTNGIFSIKKAEWIVNQCVDMAQVSFDGVADIQNFQRPLMSGKGSFPIVYRTSKYLFDQNVPLTIHSVITENSVKRIPEIINFFVKEFPGATIHIEPVSECGRGLRTGQKFPSPQLFIDGFLEAEEIARKHGSELFYSAVRSDLTDMGETFCGVSSPGFVVTPEGLITACHEVSKKDHVLANTFIYGFFDEGSNTFCFLEEKIKNLRNLSQKKNPACVKCFAKYYCAGDCPIKNLTNGSEQPTLLQNPRCGINQKITNYYIFKSFLEGGDLYENEENYISQSQN